MKISVIIPTYNRSYIINRTLESVQKQTSSDWECIIVDDYSTDNTKEIVDFYIMKDNRFSYLLNRHKKGAPGARNTGLLAASGDYVVLFDSDNVMHPTFLEKVYDAIKMTNIDVCSCFSRVLDATTGNVVGHFNWIGYGNVHNDLLKGNCYFDNSSTIIKKQKLIEIGLLDENCPSYQEFETHIRLSKYCNYFTLEEELIDYYRGGDDTISKSISRSVLGNLYILKKYRKEFLLRAPLSLLKRAFGVYCMIDFERENGREYKSLVFLFTESVPFCYRIAIKFLFMIKPLVRNVKNRSSM